MANFAFSVKCQRCRGQAAAFKGSARMHEASLLMIFRQIFLLIVAELCCQEKLLLDIYGYIYIRYQNFVSGIEIAIFEMSLGVLVLH